MQLILLIGLVLLSGSALAAPMPASNSGPETGRPNFADIQDVQTKKSEFFNYLMPFVLEANDAIKAERSIVLRLEAIAATGQALTQSQRTHLLNLAKKYRFAAKPEAANNEIIKQVLQRVDVLPVSLVLAQAANESGWGTSRFAQQANNYFGMWCYQAGCGLKPRQRDHGQSHEVKRFDHAQESVISYLHNLNTNRAYQPLRDLRETMRDMGAPLRGVFLAEGLQAYSSRGAAYIKDIQNMIISNKLEQLAFEVASQ